MIKARGTPFQDYEGKKLYDRHVRLTKDMLNHPRYMELSNTAKVLYTYMSLWAAGNREFDYSWKLASKYIGSNTTYISNKNILIKNGFIECIRTSKCSRYSNRYKFVAKWYK